MFNSGLFGFESNGKFGEMRERREEAFLTAVEKKIIKI